ncbi:MAG: RNA chaperone Hfq [Negativicoccus succinicivorans]|uniref:RNA chaperone Hfq n=1 Tax=Negativicoccus succinicivorans TaxID=620903 RepID=UPI000763FD37|nr:RNA chaperone Hfq [Negativicoccus succinicivorans]KWZ84403.1 RNA chaperone Hfq [Anaerococcus hydrogenalis]MDU5914746.1 RNA chaperone Hfq [Negativicoccus succinicivorans]
MTNKINLQDTFLDALKKAKATVNIYLLNGVKLQGIVKDYDNFTVLLKSQEKEQLIYKHAISTIQEGEKE